ncbi:MAG: recombinase family protein [Anaerolineae bacterium]|nr:recombinase family protein [Anaerolineae bacterium]
MRAGLYARVSREEQAEGYSIDEQMEAMHRFCKERGWTVAAEYAELGYTGTVTERPEFSRALDDCQARKLDILLTHQLDRFYRNLALQLETLGQLGGWGVGYLSVTEQIDYSTPQGMLFLQMLGAFNEYYVANLSRETKKGKRGRAKSGKSNASLPAYGYTRNDDGEDVIEPNAAKGVILAFESYATEQHSDPEVAGILNRAGYAPSGRAKSGRWTREGVRYMLTNPFYIGLIRYGEEYFPGQHQPLIERELWDRVQAIRKKRGSGKGAGRKPDRVYLLSRLARCSDCGLRLTSQTSKGKGRKGHETQYYHCPSYRRSIDCSTDGEFAPADEIDPQVAALIARLRLPDDWRERLDELSEHREERENVDGKRTYLKGKLRRLRTLYLEGDIDKAEYDREKHELQAKLDALQVPEQPALEQAGETLESLGAEWANAPKHYQHEMLKVIFEAVYVDVKARKLVCVKPHPQFAPLFSMDGLEERDGLFYGRAEA